MEPRPPTCRAPCKTEPARGQARQQGRVELRLRPFLAARQEYSAPADSGPASRPGEVGARRRPTRNARPKPKLRWRKCQARLSESDWRRPESRRTAVLYGRLRRSGRPRSSPALTRSPKLGESLARALPPSDFRQSEFEKPDDAWSPLYRQGSYRNPSPSGALAGQREFVVDAKLEGPPVIRLVRLRVAASSRRTPGVGRPAARVRGAAPRTSNLSPGTTRSATCSRCSRASRQVDPDGRGRDAQDVPPRGRAARPAVHSRRAGPPARPVVGRAAVRQPAASGRVRLPAAVHGCSSPPRTRRRSSSSSSSTASRCSRSTRGEF